MLVINSTNYLLSALFKVSYQGLIWIQSKLLVKHFICLIYALIHTGFDRLLGFLNWSNKLNNRACNYEGIWVVNFNRVVNYSIFWVQNNSQIAVHCLNRNVVLLTLAMWNMKEINHNRGALFYDKMQFCRQLSAALSCGCRHGCCSDVLGFLVLKHVSQTTSIINGNTLSSF